MDTALLENSQATRGPDTGTLWDGHIMEVMWQRSMVRYSE